jgi:hypothetical protein
MMDGNKYLFTKLDKEGPSPYANWPIAKARIHNVLPDLLGLDINEPRRKRGKLENDDLKGLDRAHSVARSGN